MLTSPESNKLSGALPSKQCRSLAYVDLSYSNLSGNFPYWVKDSIQSNFIANFFTAESTNSGQCSLVSFTDGHPLDDYYDDCLILLYWHTR
ncbi:probable LRR receptor-like serine/threonine-protein kinase At1g56130 [Rhodamnia argentea]|uniref:Probable LRR receptor-like serine/threonine-protein kinase At1g56130 n=1 Tax=Rhodamnia argentea TaxID=178133 RepID=A0ABM3HKP9_9MYRT|nr:probable LRR receptor-like serine/threonine-protein kinase At1g56130 [Rhodamnia argentea]